MFSPSSHTPRISLRYFLFIVVCILFTSGCVTYSGSIRQAQNDVLDAQPERAVAFIDEQLEVANTTDLPKTLSKGQVLLLLERATLLQALGDYQQAGRDMSIVDQRMEYLDIDAYDRVELAKWLFSDDAELYRAPAYERLLLNILNMVNFLATKDLASARVEARRFNLLADYFLNQSNEEIQYDILGLGYYLGGYIFEHSNEFNDANRFYSDAYSLKFRDPTFEERLTDIMRTTGDFRPKRDDEALRTLAKQARSLGVLPRQAYKEKYKGTDLMVIAQTGMAPYKRPQYVPIGAAIVLAGAASSSYQLTTDEITQAELLAARGALTTVNLPVLVTHDVPYNPPFTLSLNSTPLEPIHDVDVTAQVERTWEQNQPAIVGSALTRAIIRALASEATNQVTKATTGNSAAGGLLALAVQGGLTLADTPDTRSWIMLPSFIYLYRLNLPTNSNDKLTFSISQGTETRKVQSNTPFEIINFSRLRQ